MDVFSSVFRSPGGRKENSPGLQAWEQRTKEIALKAPPARHAVAFLHRYSGRTASRGRPNRVKVAARRSVAKAAWLFCFRSSGDKGNC